MRYLSLFSGIEAATVAWHDLDGFEPVAFCEIDKFPSAVLAYHYPDVPNLGDITQVDWKEFLEQHGAIDLIVGGSPCQSFSIAGGRESLDGESRLMFEYIRAVQDVRPTWFLWENVPGVLSTRDDAFEQLLSEMAQLGYGMSYGTLDAQFFGVAQRRRRVFLVGYLGNVGCAAAVLFDLDSVCGNTQTSRQKREELTRTAGLSSEIMCLQGVNFPNGYQNGSGIQTDGSCYTLNCTDIHGVAFAQNERDELRIVNGDGQIVGLLAAQPGMKQTSYVMCMASDAQNAAIDDDMAGTLLSGGGSPPMIVAALSAQGTTREFLTNT